MKKSLILVMCFFYLGMQSHALGASSPWFNVDGAKLRLVALPSPDGKTIDAGLQIELEKGWKTYWRSPGASGIPPEISFSSSKNIASLKLDYPIPITFGEKENLTAGYKNSITFPIKIELLFSNRPVTINAKGLLGICGEVCLPVQFDLSLLEDGKGFSSRDVASTLLKSRSSLIGKPRDDFYIKSVKLVSESENTLKVTARVPEGSSKGVLFVEGPSDWYLTPARALKIENNIAHFSVRLSDIPKTANPLETQLTLSLVADGAGIEQKIKPTN